MQEAVGVQGQSGRHQMFRIAKQYILCIYSNISMGIIHTVVYGVQMYCQTKHTVVYTVLLAWESYIRSYTVYTYGSNPHKCIN